MTVATNAQDVVAVLKSDFSQVFEKARAIKISINRSSKAMEHPLETGATITDHRIIMPNTAEMSLILASDDYKSVYQQIRDLFINGELLTVQTRVDSFTNMLIEKMPHEETGEMFDAVAVGLSLKEALFVTPQFSKLTISKVATPKDATKVDRGQQQPTETPATSSRKSSVLASFFK